jgi:hypothetical protein
MKRIILLFLLLTAFTGFSQIPQEYAIKQPLRLQTVNLGSKTDSVLVRGASGVIKYIPRSEFTSKGENLQSVLDNGNTFTDGINTLTMYPNFVQARSNNGNETSYINTFSFTTNNDVAFTGASLTNNGQLRLNTLGKAQTILQESNSTLIPRIQKLPDADGTLSVSVNGNFSDTNGNIINTIDHVLNAGNVAFDKTLRFGAAGGNYYNELGSNYLLLYNNGNLTALNSNRIYLQNNVSRLDFNSDAIEFGMLDDLTNRIRIEMPYGNPLKGATRILPLSVNKMVSNTDGNIDVKFNSIFDDGNNVYSNAASSAKFQVGLSGTSSSDNFGYYSDDPLTGGVSLSAGKSGGGFSFRNGDYSNQINFSLDNVNSDIRLEVIKNFNSTSLRFEEPLNAENAIIYIPAKKTGNYVVAVTSDIAVSNSTTVSLSAADLNAAYPNSVTGRKVQCVDISAGAKIYEKTITGWVEYSVTALP